MKENEVIRKMFDNPPLKYGIPSKNEILRIKTA